MPADGVADVADPAEQFWEEEYRRHLVPPRSDADASRLSRKILASVLADGRGGQARRPGRRGARHHGRRHVADGYLRVQAAIAAQRWSAWPRRRRADGLEIPLHPAWPNENLGLESLPAHRTPREQALFHSRPAHRHPGASASGDSTSYRHAALASLTRPSMGAWLLYGLGTENQDLPGYVTINPPPNFGGAKKPENNGSQQMHLTGPRCVDCRLPLKI